MNIYIAHARNVSYREKIYRPIRESILNIQNNFTLPHEHPDSHINSLELFKEGKIKLIIADLTEEKIGMGIELGFAKSLNIPIALIFPKENPPKSRSISVLSEMIYDYENPEDMILKITEIINKVNATSSP